MITFAYPWLFLLLPLPIILYKMLPAHPSLRPSLRVPFLARVAELTNEKSTTRISIPTRPRLLSAWMILGWLCLTFAIARPLWLGEPIRKVTASRDLLLAIDLSGSMATTDFPGADGEPVDRLSGVKTVLDSFLAKRAGDRVGIILFGSAAFVQVPFTDDLDLCRRLLNEAQLGMAGPKTVLGDSMGLALTLFARSKMKDKVLIVLTDGNDTASDVPPATAAEIARDNNVVIHTIAVGDPKSAGEEKLDEETLKQVAQRTGGQYFRATDRVALEKSYDTLDKLSTRELETLSHRPRQELFPFPLAAFLLGLFATHIVYAVKNGGRA